MTMNTLLPDIYVILSKQVVRQSDIDRSTPTAACLITMALTVTLIFTAAAWCYCASDASGHEAVAQYLLSSCLELQ